MVSDEGNIDVLLQSVIGGSLAHVIGRITTEKRAAEALAKRSTEPLRSQMYNYAQLCLCLKFWLTTKNRPRNCHAFERFRPLTESLVSQRALPASMLGVFERPS